MRFQCTNAVWWNYAFAHLRGNNGSGLTIQEKNFAAQRFCGKPVEQHQKNERAGRASESNCARSRGCEYQAPSFCDPFKSVACFYSNLNIDKTRTVLTLTNIVTSTALGESDHQFRA